MEQAAAWIAPVATTIAAMMTAANAGPRLTGYGFAVFAIGSVAWAGYGAMTGQPNLLYQNALLLLINLTGVWRWLGRSARYADGAEAAADASGPSESPLRAASSLASLPVIDRDGEKLGTMIEAMIDTGTGSHSGHIRYMVLSHGGIVGVGERLIGVPWPAMSIEAEAIRVDSVRGRIERAQTIPRDSWPNHLAHPWDAPEAR